MLSGCTYQWAAKTIDPCPDANRPATSEESFLAILLALKDKGYEIQRYDMKARTVRAYYEMPYRGEVYNVTWLVSVDQEARVHVATERRNHRSGQLKNARRWFQLLVRIYGNYWCRSADELRAEAVSRGIIRSSPD